MVTLGKPLSPSAGDVSNSGLQRIEAALAAETAARERAELELRHAEAFVHELQSKMIYRAELFAELPTHKANQSESVAAEGIEKVIERLDAGIAEEQKATDVLLSRLRNTLVAA